MIAGVASRARAATGPTLLCALAIAFPIDAHAAPCAGFDDVDSADLFCPNVEWLRNRGITLGCTASTYCPNEPVTRLAMAAFLNRLGNATSPVVLEADSAESHALVGLSGPLYSNVICETADVPAGDYPRRAIVHGFLSGITNVSQPINVDLVASADAGATWTYLALPLNVATFSPTSYQSVSHASTIDLAAGQTLRFGIAPTRFLSSDATTIGATCSVRAVIVNRTSSTPPLAFELRSRSVPGEPPRRRTGPWK